MLFELLIVVLTITLFRYSMDCPFSTFGYIDRLFAKVNILLFTCNDEVRTKTK